MNLNELLPDRQIGVQFPSLKEKALIDLVNGLEVVDDHLICRSDIEPILTRCWHALSGKTNREQYLVDLNLATGLRITVDWLKDLQFLQAESDLAITFVAQKLLALEQALTSQGASLNAELRQVVHELGSRLNQVEARVDGLEAQGLAELQIRGVRQRWRDLIKGSTPITTAFLLIDELWWGRVGSYVRHPVQSDNQRDLLERAVIAVGDALATDLSVPAKQMLTSNSFWPSAPTLEASFTEVVTYLGSTHSTLDVPLTTAVVRAAKGTEFPDLVSDSRLPSVLSPLGAARRLFHESKRMTSALSPELARDQRAPNRE